MSGSRRASRTWSGRSACRTTPPRRSRSANDSTIREFAVPHSYSEAPEADSPAARGRSPTRSTSARSPASRYFFARELRKSVDVPDRHHPHVVGRREHRDVDEPAALGMTRQRVAARWSKERARTDRFVRAALRAKIGDFPTADPGLVDGRAVWADPALDDERLGDDQHAGALGDRRATTAWMASPGTARRSRSRPTRRAAPSAVTRPDRRLRHHVGERRRGRADEQQYAEPRMYDGAGVGAARGAQRDRGARGRHGRRRRHLRRLGRSVFVEVGGVRRPLAGTWRFKVGMVSFQPDGQRINKVPTILYNRMIHPLLGFPIKGVIWYQGESNANNMEQATEYRRAVLDDDRELAAASGAARGSFPVPLGAASELRHRRLRAARDERRGRRCASRRPPRSRCLTPARSSRSTLAAPTSCIRATSRTSARGSRSWHARWRTGSASRRPGRRIGATSCAMAE